MNFAEKLRKIRIANDLSQDKLAAIIGISRSYVANVELGKAKPTPVFINCVALTFGIDRSWLVDDACDDLTPILGSINMIELIMEKYAKLDDRFKKYVEKQIGDLLELQESVLKREG